MIPAASARRSEDPRLPRRRGRRRRPSRGRRASRPAGTRPAPTRVAWHDGDAGRRRALERLDLAGRRVAGAGAGAHDPAGAGRDGGVDQHAVRALVAEHDVDTRQRPQVDAGEPAAERGAPARAVVEHHPPVAVDPAQRSRRAVPERRDPHRVRLRHVAGAVDRVVEQHERARARAPPSDAASRTALTTLSGPSPESADAGRIAPVSTTGRSPATTRWSSQAVSSSVFVPCVIDDAVGLVALEQAADELDEVGEVVVREGVGAEAAERDLERRRATCASSGAMPASSSPGARRTPRLEVRGEVEPIRARRVDGAAGRDDRDARRLTARAWAERARGVLPARARTATRGSPRAPSAARSRAA